MSDRQPWLGEPCPTCGARSGLRCQTSRYGGKPSRLLARRAWVAASLLPVLQGAAGRAVPDTDRQASRPAAHGAAAATGRRELFAEQDVWQELERWGAAVALVRFSGGGGSQGSIAAVTLEDAEEARAWPAGGSGEGELPEALAAPIWARYALLRGHPRISGLLMWDVHERQVVVAGERGGQKFDELLSAPRQLYLSPTRHARGHQRGRRVARVRCPGAPRQLASRCREASRSCERCGEPLPPGLRAEARYCSKRELGISEQE